MTIVDLSRSLADRKITSRQLVEQSLTAIRDPLGEGSRAFLLVHESAALAAADRVDAQRRSGAKLPALAGIPISIKDLFDEAGVTTLGGSKVLVGAAPAARDSTVVERLRKAGAVIVGRTNLTEFAYSGLGINPHYGTPRNAFDRAAARLPGGSSSGAAISVTDGMAAGAIGTDTGGSVRIPAALERLGRIQTDCATRAARRRAPSVAHTRFGRADREDGCRLRAARSGAGQRGRWKPRVRTAARPEVRRAQDGRSGRLVSGSRQRLLRSARAPVGCRCEHRRTADGRVRAGRVR